MPEAHAAGACGAGGPCVVVTVVSGQSAVGLRTFDASDLVPDVDPTSYSVRFQNGQTADENFGSGTSLRSLVGLTLADEGKTLTDASFAEVTGSDPYRHLLSHTELGPAGNNGFQGSFVPAFVPDNQSPPDTLGYIRPLRGDNDVNGSVGPDFGFFYSDDHGPLYVTVHLTGSVLDGLHVAATPTDAGRRTWTLSVDRAAGQYTFDWLLPDGTHSGEPSPTYTFHPGDVAGTYPVSVGVEDPSDGSFGYGTASLQIGAVPSTSASPSTSPGTGGNGGGSNGPTAAPSASFSANPNPDPSPGNGGSAHPTATSGPTATSTATATPTSVPTSGATGGGSASSAPTSKPTRSPTPDAVGDQVTGILLTAAESGQQPGSVSDVPDPSQAARPVSDPPLHVDPLVWGGVLGVLLLLAGAASESVRVRRWLRMGP